jgi:fluoride exporter
MQWIWIALGGALGSVARHLAQSRIQASQAGQFPLGTLSVNLIGSAIIGMLAGWFLANPVSPTLRLFLIVGILGGFTTFSSFSLDALNLLRDGQVRTALYYVLASNLGGMALACGGFLLARALAASALGS